MKDFDKAVIELLKCIRNSNIDIHICFFKWWNSIGYDNTDSAYRTALKKYREEKRDGSQKLTSSD